MTHKLLISLLLLVLSSASQARDFENAYAVYGAGADNCSQYIESINKGGAEQDYFIDWMIGYLSAFNVIMPNTYNVLGETGFDSAQLWLETRCKQFPKEPFITAMIKLTEILYPMRYQSSLKNPAATTAPAVTPAN